MDRRSVVKVDWPSLREHVLHCKLSVMEIKEEAEQEDFSSP